MNERIKELAVEARLLTGWPTGEVEYQKFAEFIISDCVNEILKWKSEPFPLDPEFLAKTIKMHFEIE